jgi:ribokinase
VIVNRVEATELDLISGDGVMVTLGSDGVDVAGTHVAAFTTTVVDPTGAGDAFTAAVAVAMAEGATPVDAARFGAAAGACAVSRLGAEPGLPTRAEVIAVLAR